MTQLPSPHQGAPEGGQETARDIVIEYFREHPHDSMTCICIHCVERRADRIMEFLASKGLTIRAAASTSSPSREADKLSIDSPPKTVP